MMMSLTPRLPAAIAVTTAARVMKHTVTLNRLPSIACNSSRLSISSQYQRRINLRAPSPPLCARHSRLISVAQFSSSSSTAAAASHTNADSSTDAADNDSTHDSTSTPIDEQISFRSFVRTRHRERQSKRTDAASEATSTSATASAVAAAVGTNDQSSSDGSASLPILHDMQRAWRDTPRLSSLKEELNGGVVRISVVRISEGRMEEFLQWAHTHLHDAYTHAGFRGGYLIVNGDTVENHSLWSSTDALLRNTHTTAYKQCMQQLSQYIVDAPTVRTEPIRVLFEAKQEKKGG